MAALCLRHGRSADGSTHRCLRGAMAAPPMEALTAPSAASATNDALIRYKGRYTLLQEVA
jgi:hypothetical protein